jgi:hypothetical protein
MITAPSEIIVAPSWLKDVASEPSTMAISPASIRPLAAAPVPSSQAIVTRTDTWPALRRAGSPLASAARVIGRIRRSTMRNDSAATVTPVIATITVTSAARPTCEGTLIAPKSSDARPQRVRCSHA